MKEMFQYLLFGQLFIAGVGSACVPVQNITGATKMNGSCPSCQNPCLEDAGHANMSADCKKAFQVYINSTTSSLDEGGDINLTCVHNLSLPLTFGWRKDEKVEESENKKDLIVKKALQSRSGLYICHVNGSCGYFESLPYEVTVHNKSAILLAIAGISSLVLILSIGLALKFKIKRDNAKHRQRVAQRTQAGNLGGPAPIVPRAS